MNKKQGAGGKYATIPLLILLRVCARITCQKIRPLILAQALILIGAISPDICSAQAGQTGLAFLKIGVGPRAAGMGNAATAVVDDASALFWNPARITAIKGMDATFIHTNWFQDVSHEFIGFTAGNGVSAVGLGFTIMSVDGLERRTNIPTQQPLASFNAYDLVLSGSYARRITETVSVGITLKGLSEKILFETASGVAFDLGVAHQRLDERLILAGTIRNIGPQMSFIREKFDLPREVRIGAGYKPAIDVFQNRVLISGDLSKYKAEPVRLNVGGEFTYQQRFSLMAGYQTRQDNTGFTTGFRAQLRQYRIDYAFVPFSSGLGNTHRFAVGLRW